MDSFFKNGIIDDAVLYLEHIPDEYVQGKEDIIKRLKEKKKEMSTAEMNPSTLPAAAVGI